MAINTPRGNNITNNSPVRILTTREYGFEADSVKVLFDSERKPPIISKNPPIFTFEGAAS